MEMTIKTPPTGPDKPVVPTTTPAPEASGEPTLILGKFKSQADLEKAYTEAEKKITELGQAPKPTPLTNLTVETAKVTGVDLDAMTAEYAKTQKLSPESLKKLNDAGFPPEVVDTYIKGQQALGEKFVDDVASVAGGRDGLTTVLTWAKQGLTASEQKVYNEALKTNNPDAVKPILRDMVSKFFQANGRTPNLVNAETGAPHSDAFESQAQVVAAMRDKRYKTDEAYRNEVARRIKAMK